MNHKSIEQEKKSDNWNRRQKEKLEEKVEWPEEKKNRKKKEKEYQKGKIEERKKEWKKKRKVI